MKKVLLPVTLFFTVAVNAQSIKLNKGQKITIRSSVTQEINMGMGGDIKNSDTSTSVVEIKEADNNNYNAVYTLTKMKMSMDGMGQQESYDSEKPGDGATELGKAIGEKVGKEVKVKIDKNSGKTTSETPESPEKKEEEDQNNPFGNMTAMIAAAETESAITESAFFLIPAGKKAGDSWSDSVNVKDAMKGIKTYTLKSINDNIATIGVFSKLDGKQNVELQGMQIDINLSAKTEGELLVDTKTFLVKKSSRVADVTGNMDMMGQSMPISSKVTETTLYN